MRHVFLGGTPEQQAQQRALFEERRQRWEAWWSEHWQEFVTPEELRSVELPKRDEDLVEMAGVARYGVSCSPPARRCGSARSACCGSTSSAYRDGKSYLDFDTGRVFSAVRGNKDGGLGPADGDFGSRITRWHRQNGIDVRCQGPLDGVDLQLWLIDDSRWETLEAEIRKDGPLPARPGSDQLVGHASKKRRPTSSPTSWRRSSSQRGKAGAGSSRSFRRIRMPIGIDCGTGCGRRRGPGNRPGRPAAEPRPARIGGTPFGPVVTTTLERPAAGRDFLLDLETGRKASSRRTS